MSNNLSAVMPKILARGLLALREQAVMPRLVNFDYAMEAAEQGDTVDIPVPSSLVASDVVPSNTLVAADDSAPSKVSVNLNNWKKVAFHLSDKEVAELDTNRHFVPMQMSEAVSVLSSEVNNSIHNLYTGVYGFAGSTAEAAFNTTDGVKAALDARKMLNKQKAPRSSRRGVIDFDTEAAALELSSFQDADRAGDSAPKIEGEIGRKFGIDWYSDDGVTTHTTGAAGTPLVKGAGQAGTTLIVDGFTTKPSVGDIFTINGDEQTYTVTAATDLSVTTSTLTVSPAVASAPSDNAAVTFKASHKVNLVFHRDAFAFVTRPLVDATEQFALGNEMMTMQDPQTGLIMRLEIARQYKRTVWELDILYGAALVRPELAVRVASTI